MLRSSTSSRVHNRPDTRTGSLGRTGRSAQADGLRMAYVPVGSTQDGLPRRLAAAWRNEDIMDRLKPLDALFVEAEDEDLHTSMAIASIAVFEGPPPSPEEFLAFLAGRLPLVPPLPPEAPCGAVPPGMARLGGRPGVRSPLSRPAHRLASARRGQAARRPDGAGDVSAARP